MNMKNFMRTINLSCSEIRYHASWGGEFHFGFCVHSRSDLSQSEFLDDEILVNA